MTAIAQNRSGEWLVKTDKGDICCEFVVNAAGLWAPEVARMVGLEIPSIAIAHTHILYETIGQVVERDKMLPLVRDPDRSIYLRQEMDSLILGMYEANGQQWKKEGVPWDYAQQELKPDIDNIADCIEAGMERFPVLADTGFKHVTAGPITYTPNGDPLVGPAAPLKNFFQANAVFGDYYGWECPNYFPPKGQDDYETPSWRRSNAFKHVAQECRQASEKVAIIDLTRFAKTKISGPAARDWLNQMSCQKIPQVDGRIALSPMLDHKGNFKSDMTVTRISENEFFCVTASVGKKHDQHWMQSNLPEDGSVQMEDLTYKMGCLVLVGPDSRKVLEKIAYNDVSNDAFKFSTSQEIYVGRTRCRINRMNYVGELGFEIFHPIEQQLIVHDMLMQAGKNFDIQYIGMYAMESMRLEKGYLAWKSEMNVHHTPLETNIAWTVKLDKDFIGKEGILKQKQAGIPRKLACLIVEAKDSDAWGYNPILKDGKMVGMTSSGGYGHRTQKSIALGYLLPEYTKVDTSLDVEILGRIRKARVASMPLYDPKNEKMKS